MSPQSLLAQPVWTAGELAVLVVVILVAGLGTGLLFVLSVAAYLRRPQPLYLLVCIAVGALFTRSIVGAGTVFGVVPMWAHHLVEHSFDFLIAAVVLYAVIVHAPGSVSNDVS